MKRTVLSTVFAILCASSYAQVTIDIDASARGPKISPTHYGIFYEDINHAADGGLYAELIRNRSFEDVSMGRPRRVRMYSGGNGVDSWTATEGAKISLTDESPLNSAQTNSLRVTISRPNAGVINPGFWGINSVSGRTYKLSFWIRSDKSYKSCFTASLISDNGKVLGSSSFNVKSGKKWHKVTATITAGADDPKAQFSLTSDKVGEYQIDVVSLFPPTYKNRENGMRKDLAEMLEAMHPRFMRFPGGCFVEGQGSPDNAFRWKRTIGPIEERPGHPNVNWGYRTTDGIGFHEYLQLAEDLGAKPLFVVNVGIWHGGCTPYDSIQDWIDECLDALEYANGDVTTKYGALRAKHGHPEPFGLEYIEIGNENYNFNMDSNSDQSDHYPERYKQFYDAIKAKYPYVHCIGNVESWGTDTPSWRNDYPVEMVDEHYYRNPKWFADRFDKYDSYRRDSHKVYVGEYAVTSQFGDLGNLNAALGEAVYMMGMENNSDVVVMNSYAPIFVNENDARWRPDMIRFNSNKVMGTPSYYVQQLFPNNIGTQVIKTNISYELPEQVAKKDTRPSHVGLATWGTTVRYKSPCVVIDGKEIALDDLSEWKISSGHWEMSQGGIVQNSDEQPAMVYALKDITAGKYSFRVRAMKESGAEGFLVMVGMKDTNTYQWYNVAGWGNTASNVEQANGGGRMQLASDHRMTVENGRWYDLRVDVDGDSIHCFIDGKKDFSVRLQNSLMSGVYASTTLDEPTGDMIVKVVNVGEGTVPAVINLRNYNARSAEITRLSSESGDDENSLDQPFKISPKKATANVISGDKVTFTVPSYSVNIIRIKK
ncbi:MAG: carbohydrate binding domain-containing protein [Bacteroidaceae bacterium]|nr:carbohydrate binding domain-containing protein [Bacteroidaceae bacterium]